MIHRLVNTVLSFAQRYLRGKWQPTNLGMARFAMVLMGIIVAGLVGFSAFSVDYQGADKKFSFTIASEEPSFWALAIVSGVLIFFGGCAGTFLYREGKLANKRTCLCVEHLAFDGSEHRRILKHLPHQLRAYQENYHGILTAQQSPERHLQSIDEVVNSAERQIAHGDPNDWFPVYGGIAHVPMVAHVGYSWGNRRPIQLMDFKRSEKRWHSNEDLDDGQKLAYSQLPPTGLSDKEIGLCIELSMDVDRVAMEADFPNTPMYFVNYDDGQCGLDRLCSEEKQQRYVQEITDYINRLIKRHDDLQAIHLFITAQSSFVFRIGAALQQPHLPKIVVHQYERNGESLKHPWGVQLSFDQDSEILWRTLG